MISVSDKFYITTAIPYVNAKPHLGHTLEFVQTDAIKRFHMLFGEECFLVTGADENSLKNVHAAEELGIGAQELCDNNSEKYRGLAEKIGLSYERFIRSSNKKEHFPGVWELWKRCEKAGDIYKKKYAGLYCVGCEAFYKENELEGGVCPEHKKKPVEIEEENYFFRLSRYQDRLKELIENNGLKIYPESRKKEILNFVEQGLEDFSISRSHERAKGWGVGVPNDSSQIMYVWFDALGCYLTGIGFGADKEKFEKWWPAQMHVIGKGITRFHAVYWPAILLSAGLELPKALFIHGYITVEGQKMSKSLGNVLDPLELIEEYGSDQLRYYLLSEIPTFLDGDFSRQRLIEKINNELVANLGNLVNRVVTFIEKNYEGKCPEFAGKGFGFEKIDEKYLEKTEKIRQTVIEEGNLKEAIDLVMGISSSGNKYLQDAKPWESVKEGAEDKAKEKTAKDLHLLLNLLKDLGILIEPFLPKTSKKMFGILNVKEGKWADLGKIEIKCNHKIGTPEMLFKKIEIKKIEEKTGGNEKKEIVFGSFDIQVGKILGAQKHPDADKLLIEVVELADGKRQIVSGIADYYAPEEITGKKVLILKNLKPAKIRGVLSQGMILVGENKEGIEILESENWRVGDKVCIEKELQIPSKEITFEEFSKIKISVEGGFVKVDGKTVLAGNSKINTKKIIDGKVR